MELRSSGPQSFRLLALPATTARGRALPAPGNTAVRLATELGAGTSRSRRWRAIEGAPAHAQAALAQPVSVAAEGDVDTEVVVVVAAPVGTGRRAQRAAGGRAGGGGLAPAAAGDAGFVGWVRRAASQPFSCPSEPGLVQPASP